MLTEEGGSGEGVFGDLPPPLPGAGGGVLGILVLRVDRSTRPSGSTKVNDPRVWTVLMELFIQVDALVAGVGDLVADLEGDLEGDFEGDLEGDLDGDLDDDLDGDLDGDLEGDRVAGEVALAAGGPVVGALVGGGAPDFVAVMLVPEAEVFVALFAVDAFAAVFFPLPAFLAGAFFVGEGSGGERLPFPDRKFIVLCAVSWQ